MQQQNPFVHYPCVQAGNKPHPNSYDESCASRRTNAMSEALNARIKLSVTNLTVITEKSFPTSGRKPLHASPLNFY